jgi:long-chain acyl-CoA synthetase
MTATTTNEQIGEAIAGQTVAKRFLANLAENGSTTVVRARDGGGEWSGITLTDLADQVARLTTGLAGLGIGKGDRVVLMMSNRPEFHALDLAVLFCGATPVSIYNSSAPSQIDYLVNHCGAKIAILENNVFLQRFDAVHDQLATVERIVLIEPIETTRADVVSLADLMVSEPADLTACAELGDAADLATIIYTSGTTGPPKGVMLSNRNVCWALESVGRGIRGQADLDGLTGLKHVSYLPMAHIFERLFGHYFMADFGLEISCCPDTAQLAAVTAEVHPNIFIGVPRVWEKLYAGVNAVLAGDPEKAKAFNEGVAMAAPIAEKIVRGTATDEEIGTWNFLDAAAFQKVKGLIGLDEAVLCVSGAAPLSAEIMTWFRSIGVPLSEGYGLSETTAVLTWSYLAKPGYVGQVVDGVEMKIADDGEVLARGGSMFEGYLNAPDKTAEMVDDDGWVYTGDIGELDDEGYLKIIDRKKELIITAGGKNVSPANLEAALKKIPLVGQACAVGEQRPFVSALVVLDPDASKAWAASHGLEGDAADMRSMAENPEVIEEVNSCLVEVMSSFNNAEAVKKLRILGEEWMPDTDLLTPTAKLKRRGILAQFAGDIEALYS